MALTFADTHNMIAYLTKSDASEGSDQIFDFLNASAIHLRSSSFGVETPLFEGMIVVQQADDVVYEVVAGVDTDDVVVVDVPVADAEPTSPSPTPTSQPPPPLQELPSTSQEDASKQGGIIAKIDADKDVTLKEVDVTKYAKVLSMEDDEPELAKLKEVVEVVTTAKLMTEIVTAAAATITAITTAASTITTAPSVARRRKGIHAHIEQDEAYARELEEELNKNINWDDVIEQNMDGFKMDYFKGMSYDDICPIFEKYFNSNVAFLEKTKEQLEEKESRALKRKTESLEEKAVKKQKLVEEVEELKKHLQIVPNDDDDVYTEATPLALKVPVVDYEIHIANNKPYYKIKRADGSHQLFLSFLSLLRNFDREWSKSQKLEIVRILWSAYHNIHNYTDDLAGREKISIDKVYFRSDAEQSLELMLLKTSRKICYGITAAG
nr:hypothetical protein [Tanacetum cinerariifolium]